MRIIEVIREMAGSNGDGSGGPALKSQNGSVKERSRECGCSVVQYINRVLGT